MTPQEKILEALGERALTGRALYQALSGENAAAVDAALSQLLKLGVVTKDLGHYQKAQRRAAVQPGAPAPAKPVPRLAAAAKAVAPAELVRSAPAKAVSESTRETAALSPRERAVYELAQKGYRRSEIMGQLEISANAVSTHLSNARLKLGARGAISALTRESKPAPAAAARVSAAPSREGAEVATAGAAPSIEVGKREVPPPAPRYSPDLRARLIQVQQAKAEELLWLQKLVDAARQELRNVEEMVRMVSEEKQV